MTLSERLEAARRARLGVPPRDEDTPPPAPQVVVVERVIDVAAAAPGLRTVAPVAESPASYEGSCPNCGREGKVDMVDLVAQTSHYVCHTCGTLWHVGSANSS